MVATIPREKRVGRERERSAVPRAQERGGVFLLLFAVTMLLTSGEDEDRHLFREPHRWVKCVFPSSDQL